MGTDMRQATPLRRRHTTMILRGRATTVLLLAAAVLSGLIVLPGANAGASVDNLHLSMQVDYEFGQRPNSAVGEAQPTLPAPPELGPLGEVAQSEPSGGEFTFRLVCGAAGSDCDNNPPLVEWDFGDGIKRTDEMETTHAYTKPGVYTVRAVAAKGSWFGQVLRTVYVAPHWADIINITTYGSVLAADAPLAWWRMNELGVNTTWVDSSGHGYNGEYFGGVSYQQDGAIVSAPTDHSVAFDGVDGKAEVSGVALVGNTAFSLEAWVYIGGTPGSPQGLLVLGPRGASTDGALELSVTAQGRIGVEHPEVGEERPFAPMSVPLGSWAHVAVTYSADGLLRGYVNGEPAAQPVLLPGSFNLNGELRIGQGRDGSAHFAGGVDEVTLYNKELTQAQVRAHYENGSSPRVFETREDREAIWVTSALGLFDQCRVATAQKDGASDFEIGRSMFCAEPKTPANFPASAPLVPGDAGDPINGITGQSCFDAWWVCNLPKDAFAGPNPTPHFTPGAAPDATLLSNLGVYDSGSGQLRYDPTNCGDGWLATETSPGVWAVEPGIEDGCVSRGEWYDILMRAVDGFIAHNPALGNARLAAPLNYELCADHEDYTHSSSLGYRRAVKLGVAENTIPGREDHCDLDRAITKREAYTSLGNVFGVKLTIDRLEADPEINPMTECQVGTPFRDLADRNLNTAANPVTGDYDDGLIDDDCVKVSQTLSRGAPVVGDMVCHWGSGNEETTCVNLDDPFTRGEVAVALGAVLTEEGRGAGGLSLDLSHDGPKPIGTVINVTAVGWAPLTTTGDLHFTFPGEGELPANVERVCDSPVSVPTQVAGDARRAVAVCGYRFNAETTFPLVVTVEDDFGNVWSQSLVVSSANEAPLVPSTTQNQVITEGDGASLLSVFSSVDLGGDAVRLEISTDSMSGWVGQDPNSGETSWNEAQGYPAAVLADNPLGYWRFNELSGLVNDATASGNNGTVVGAPTRGSCGIHLTGVDEECDNNAYHFDGDDHIDFDGVAVSAGAGSRTTVEMWVRWDGGDGTLIAFDEQSLRIEDGFLGFGGSESFSIGSGEDEITWETSVLVGADISNLEEEWMYVVAEFGSTLTGSRLYVNGVERNLNPVIGFRTDNNIQSASSTFRIGEGFVGTIDEVALYNGSLAAHRRVYHQELGTRTLIATNDSGTPLAALSIEAITSSTARVTATPLSGDVNGTFSYHIRGCDYEKCSLAADIDVEITPTQDNPLGVSGGVIYHNPSVAVEGGGQFTFTLLGDDPDDKGWMGAGGNPHSGDVTRLRIVDVDWIDPEMWGTPGAPESLEYDSGGGVWVSYAGGAVETENFNLRYTPGAEPYGDGDLAVHYQVLDTGYPAPPAWSEVRTALIRIHSTNTPPLCLPVVDSTLEDTPKSIAFNCVDDDGDDLEYEIVSGPAIGELSGEGGSRLYSPAQDWCSETPVSYTYRAFDGSEYSETVSVEIAVTCVNDAPTEPTGAMPTANEDTNAVANFSTTDVDGGPEWTFLVSANGVDGWSASSVNITGGTVSLDQGDLTDKTVEVTFDNTANWCGDYTFYLKANDGEADSPVRQVDATMTCVNDAPTIPTPSTMPTVNEDTNAVQTFTTTDVDGGPNWTFQVSASSGSGFSSSSANITGGTVSVNQGSLTDLTASVTFDNSANWCGNYTFYIRVFDGIAYSPVQTVTGTITCVNDAPTTPTINSAWGTQYEDGGNIAVTHGSGATRAWERTYTTTDVDTSGTGSNRWCMQVRAWDGSWQPSSVSNCPSNTNTSNWVETAITRSGTTNYVWGLVQQGSLTDKTAKLRIIPRPNFDGNVSVSVRFCDDGGLCSGAHTQTLSIKPYKDHVILVDYASGNFRWRESNPIGAGLSNSNQWATANLNGTHRSQPVVGDWNGDGRDERAVLHKSNNDITGTWVFNSEFGTSLPAYWEVPVPSSSSSDQNGRRGGQVRAFAGDWDGDGDDDYALWSNLAGRVWLLNNGTGASTCWGLPVTPPSNHWRSGCSNAASGAFEMVQGQAVASGDVNGDGRDEVFHYDVYMNSSNHDNRGLWQVRTATNGAYAVSVFWFGPSCDYTATNDWMEQCFAVVGDWDGNGTETVGVFLRAPFGSHPRNRFFWSNNYSGTLAGQHDFPNGSQQSTYMGVFGYDKP